MSKNITHKLQKPLSDEKYKSLDELVLSLKDKKYDYRANKLYEKDNLGVEGQAIIFEISLEGRYTTTNALRSQFEGIELLKWLRVNKIYNHCVLTSFLPLHEILSRNPNFGIIGSKGTSFVQLPDDFNDIDRDCFYANEHELKQLFRTDIDFTLIRHEEANWWGLYKLYFYHKQNSNYVNQKIEAVAERNHKNLQHAIVGYCNASTDEEINSKDNNIPKRIEDLRKHTKTVVFIDDHANDGWADLLGNILFGDEAQKLIVINPNSSDSVDELFYQYKQKIRRKKVNLLISDLRLSIKEENITDYKELKSYELIKKIREHEETNYKLKIMYLTAANNLTMYKNLLIEKALRPNKLFVKEGREMGYTEKKSFDNYKSLLGDLNDLLKVNGSKKQIRVEEYDGQEELKIEEVIGSLKTYNDNEKAIERIRNCFQTFSKIIVDTTVFVNESDSLNIFKILVSNRDKLVVHRAVKMELKLHTERNKDELKSHLADFYLKFIDFYRIEIVGDKIDYQNMKEEFADEHLVRFTTNYIQNPKIGHVLFVSNDTKSYPPGPHYVLLQNKPQNLEVWDHKKLIDAITIK